VKLSLESTPRARDEMPTSALCTGSEMPASAASVNMTSMVEGPRRMDTPTAARCEDGRRGRRGAAGHRGGGRRCGLGPRGGQCLWNRAAVVLMSFNSSEAGSST
jgi:hypothetical protein